MTEDRRIRKTKQLLCETLKSLLETKSFDDIKVNAICKAARINRMTFYARFSDKNQLLSAMYAELGNRAVAACIDLNRQNNAGGDAKKLCVNMFVSLVGVIMNGWQTALTAVIGERGEAYDAMMRFFRRTIEEMIKRLEETYILRYSKRQTLSLMCAGAVDFVLTTLSDPNTAGGAALEACEDYYRRIIDLCVAGIKSPQ